jgi:hypothetical protein
LFVIHPSSQLKSQLTTRYHFQCLRDL